MSTIPAKPQPAWSNDPPPPVRWRCWPAREHVLSGLAALAGLAAVGLGVYQVTGRVHLALLAFAALAISLWRCFVPTTYELHADGIDRWVLGQHRRTPWSAIRRFEVCARGVLLLPYSDYCPMDALRGLYLPWGDRRDEVLAQLHYHLNRPIEI